MALAPLLLALTDREAPGTRRAFLLGLVTGLGYFAGTVYWTPAVVQTFGGLNWPLAIGAGSLLIAYLALFPALFAVVIARLCARFGPAALLLAPSVWVATELLRRWVLGGFPWVLLGYSQAGVVPVVQTASVVGVYGLSAVVTLASAGLVLAVRGEGRLRVVAPLSVAIAIAALIVWGQWRVTDAALIRQGTPVTVGLVQGNIPQAQKWDQARASQILGTYLELTQQAASRGATLVVWPESSTPFLFEHDGGGNAAIRSAVRLFGVSLLFGSDQYEPGPPARFYNSAFLLAPDGRTASVYRKMHLVPFGEYVPLKRLLFFVGPLVDAVSDFSPGEAPVVMAIGAQRLSTAICYEVVYPDLIAAFVSRGSQLLTTITNDAWYGKSSAPYQHFWQAVVRSVEQGRYLVRAANTGISGIVDPYGRVLAVSPIFERTVLVGEARYLEGRTIYGRTGDGFAWACALVTLLAWAMARRATTAQGRSR